MKVFKFGGASVKDAESVKNVVRVLKHEGIENTLIVISAMGKMTNAFEKIVDSYYSKNDNLAEQIEFARNFHLEIIENWKNKWSELFNSVKYMNLDYSFVSSFLSTYYSTENILFVKILNSQLICA